MGNRCPFKKKKEPFLKKDDCALNQITVETIGDCFICEEKSVAGFKSISVIEEYKVFICNKCKNL